MSYYKVTYGLGGGFGGDTNEEIVEAVSTEDANKIAYELAKECYQDYEGLHGLMTQEELMEEEGIEAEEEGREAYMQEMESWICYSVVGKVNEGDLA